MENASRDAALLLKSNCVASMLSNHDVEQRFVASKTGGTVNVKYRNLPTAYLDEDTAGKKTLQDSDAGSSSVAVDATNYIHVKHELDSKELTYELEDFTREITAPAMVSIAEQIDQFFIRRIAGGFARNLVGTAGTAASTKAHILAGVKQLNDNKVSRNGRVAIIGTQAESNFLQLDEFVNNDYGQDGPNALREALLSRRYGVDWYMDQNAGVFEQGDEAGTVLVAGGSQSGTALAVDGFTAATGKIREGTRFTVAGNATVYTVTADTAIASNAASLPITPALAATPSDNAAVTFQTPFTSDVIYNRNAVAAAIVAPAPLAQASAIARTEDGISVRMSFESSFSGSNGATDSVLFDVYVGSKVIRPEMGTILQG